MHLRLSIADRQYLCSLLIIFTVQPARHPCRRRGRYSVPDFTNQGIKQACACCTLAPAAVRTLAGVYVGARPQGAHNRAKRGRQTGEDHNPTSIVPAEVSSSKTLNPYELRSCCPAPQPDPCPPCAQRKENFPSGIDKVSHYSSYRYYYYQICELTQ